MQIQTDTEALEKYRDRDRNIRDPDTNRLSETERNRKIWTVRQRQRVTKIGSLRRRLR